MNTDLFNKIFPPGNGTGTPMPGSLQLGTVVKVTRGDHGGKIGIIVGVSPFGSFTVQLGSSGPHAEIGARSLRVASIDEAHRLMGG